MLHSDATDRAFITSNCICVGRTSAQTPELHNVLAYFGKPNVERCPVRTQLQLDLALPKAPREKSKQHLHREGEAA